MPTETRIHVIDDDAAMRDSLAFLFDSVDLPARTYPSAAAFLEVAGGASQGCVVTDIRMPGMSGIELLHALKARSCALPVIVITGHADVPLAIEAMKAGALDFLEKPFANKLLLDSVYRALAQSAAGPQGEELAMVQAKLSGLSQRERQVLKGLVAGQINKVIAFELGLSTRTVEIYRAKVMAKMKADSFADLVRMVLQAGEQALT